MWILKFGYWIFLLDFAKRLQTSKEHESESDKQKRPPEETREVKEGEEWSESEKEREILRHVPRLQSYRGKWRWNWGWESKRKEEKGEEEEEEEDDEGECFEMNEGEKINGQKPLQVDLRDMKVLRGRKERMYSRISGGNLLQIFGSIGSDLRLMWVMFWLFIFVVSMLRLFLFFIGVY